MTVLELLKSLKFKALFSLIKLFSRNILMIYPTIKATISCIKTTEKLFPGIHHINNSANAFRHSLWNALLVKEMMKWNKSLKKSIEWAKKISDWHEDFSPNLPLAKEMDLHNNKVGRLIFEQHYIINNAITKQDLIEIIKTETLNSYKVNSISEINNYKTRLVHLLD